MKRKFLLLYSWFVRTLLFFLPDIPFIMRFRGWLLGLGMARCEKDFQVTHNAIIKDLQNIYIGSNIFIGNNTIIMGSGTCVIEDQVQFAPNCVVISGNHTSKNNSYRYGDGDIGLIKIEYGSWISANCTIAKGSKLPRNSVLAANSFLNKEFQIPNSLYGGVPAKLIKTYK